MKFYVFTAVLCAVTATGFAQSKPPNVAKLQNTLGSLLGLVKDLTVATNQVMSDDNVQAALKTTQDTLTSIKNLYPMYGTTYTSSVPLAQRNKLNISFNNFKNAISALDASLGQFPLAAGTINSKLLDVHNSFLTLGNAVVPL